MKLWIGSLGWGHSHNVYNTIQDILLKTSIICSLPLVRFHPQTCFNGYDHFSQILLLLLLLLLLLQLIYNVLPSSVLPQSDPITHISLCYTVRSHCPSIPNITVCIKKPPKCPSVQFPPLSLLGSPSLFLAMICFCFLFDIFRQDHLFHILDFTNK